MKRFAYILLAVVVLAAAVLFSGCNKTVADLTYKYDYSTVLQDFAANEQINYSFSNFGFLYPLDKAMEERVRRFEKEYGYLVYHVIDNPTSIGRMHSYLYVSSNEEEWEQDRQDRDRAAQRGRDLNRVICLNS